MSEEVQNHIQYNFTMIKNEVIESKDFDRSIDKLVYITLLKYGFGKGTAFPTLKTIADDCLISSKSTLTASLKRLVARKYLFIERRKNLKGEFISNVYHIYEVNSVVQKMDNPSPKNGQPSPKNGQEEDVLKNKNLKGVKKQENKFEKDIQKYKPVYEFIQQKFITVPMSIYQKLDEWIEATSTDQVLGALTDQLDEALKIANQKGKRKTIGLAYAIGILRNSPNGIVTPKQNKNVRKVAEQEAIRRWLDGQAASN